MLRPSPRPLVAWDLWTAGPSSQLSPFHWDEIDIATEEAAAAAVVEPVAVVPAFVKAAVVDAEGPQAEQTAVGFAQAQLQRVLQLLSQQVSPLEAVEAVLVPMTLLGSA